MGLRLSLRTVYEAALVTVPSVIDGLRGRLDRDLADARIAAFSRRVIDLARVNLDVRGADTLPRDRAFVFMSNHQSHIDIPVVYAALPGRTMRMVAKAELFRIPLFGRALRAGEYIEVDRGDRAQAIASLERAAALIRDGVNIWIAPEGSRSSSGALGPLKKGGFHLAKNTGTPIVPVALRGTGGILAKGGRRMNYDQAVRVTVGAPIPVNDRTIDELLSEVSNFLVNSIRSSSST